MGQEGVRAEEGPLNRCIVFIFYDLYSQTVVDASVLHAVQMSLKNNVLCFVLQQKPVPLVFTA